MDVFDEDLVGMVNFTDETAPKQMPVMEHKHKPKESHKEEPAVNAIDATPNNHRDTIDKLFAMAKWLCVCGGISMLMWWFEINGLMAMEAAYPCILASSIIGAAGTAWSAK